MVNRTKVCDLEGLDSCDRMLASDMDDNSPIYAEVDQSHNRENAETLPVPTPDAAVCLAATAAQGQANLGVVRPGMHSKKRAGRESPKLPRSRGPVGPTGCQRRATVSLRASLRREHVVLGTFDPRRSHHGNR
jgi:hypothetical protein